MMRVQTKDLVLKNLNGTRKIETKRVNWITFHTDKALVLLDSIPEEKIIGQGNNLANGRGELR